jgi:hypothetical protein
MVPLFILFSFFPSSLIALCSSQDMYFSIFRMKLDQMNMHLAAYQSLFLDLHPSLYKHFDEIGVRPDMYIYEWLITIFSRSLRIEIAHRIWDNFLSSGIVFLFRVAFGILRYHTKYFLENGFDECLCYLNRPPKVLCAVCVCLSGY